MCLAPMLAIPDGCTSSGKTAWKVVSSWPSMISQDEISFYVSSRYGTSLFQQVPCGQCIECRLKHSREWAVRMMLEAQYHKCTYFLTLTYDSEHVPMSFYGDPDTGEAIPTLTLYKKDLQDFWKRLRRYLGYHGFKGKIRYYACGEYGDKTHRPHYHAVVFGLPLDDLKPYKKSFNGMWYYTSEMLDKVWQNGGVIVGAADLASCAYVARYVTKKWNGEYKDFYDRFNIAEEFSVCSRKPGLAYQYFEDHKDEIYDFDRIFLNLKDEGKNYPPPKYFDRKFSEIEEELFDEVRARRVRKAEATQRLRDLNNNLSFDEQLQARIALYKKRMEMLPRKEI